jgi:hypothetical protein
VRRLSALVLVLGVGCGETEVSKVEAVKNRVCACKDVACADAAMQALPTPAKVSHREQGVARDTLDCYAKLVAAAKPAETTEPGSGE